MARIETVEDIEKLLRWINDNTQKPNLGFYRHVFLKLHAGGAFEAVHVDSLVKMVSRNKLWSDQFNAVEDVEAGILRDRFSRRIRWMNDTVLAKEDSPYRDSLAIVYDRASSRYQMVTDPERVKAFRNRNRERRAPEVDIGILAEGLYQAMPSLQVGSELEFGIRSSIEGYVHVFHRDVHGHVDQLFPEPGSELSLKVCKGKDIFFPDAVGDLCKLKCWRIGALDGGEGSGKQRLLVMVTARNAEITVEDAIAEFGNVNPRPINVEHLNAGDLTARQKLSAVAEYWLQS